MKFGAFFVGQRPLLHEQYDDEHKANPNPVSRTDVQVYQYILKGAELADKLAYSSFGMGRRYGRVSPKAGLRHGQCPRGIAGL